MTLWFDVEDLIEFFQRELRPTGIQRLSFEIYRELWKQRGASGLVRFCRHGATAADYLLVDWPQLEAAILANAAGSQPAEPRGRTKSVEPVQARAGLKHRVHRYLYQRIAPAVRTPLGVSLRAQKQSLDALAIAVKALVLGTTEPRMLIPLSNLPADFEADDVFVSIGASWTLPNPAPGPEVQQRYGLRFAVLIHDLIPDLYPEWTSKEGLPNYRAWLRNVVPRADIIFANSRNTARDLVRRMAEWNKPVPAPLVLPIGHYPASRKPEEAVQATQFDRPFVLFVSTIEVRKNHALLFRVWRRLLEDLPGQVPYLVFAGKIGWLTGDFLVQLDNADWLDGTIKLVESPSEQELAALYAGCAFTVFPSLYEGWGLPVTESLSFGKTVAASNSSAIPEAGGAFCSYFDPENPAEAYAVIRFLIENPERVAELEAKIAADFRPPSWADTAAELLRVTA